MAEIQKRGNDYIGYDYLELRPPKNQISMYLDSYENFGWTIDDNKAKTMEKGETTLYLKRNRKILNKAELTRLQRHFEDCMVKMKGLEAEKTRKATIISMTIGIIGTAFMAGSVFAVTATSPKLGLCILLAIPAFLGWISPYYVYKKVKAKTTEKIIPLIEEKWDEIDEICRKGHDLLN